MVIFGLSWDVLLMDDLFIHHKNNGISCINGDALNAKIEIDIDAGIDRYPVS